MDKFWERYIQSRPAPGSSKGAFDAFAAEHRNPGPRNNFNVGGGADVSPLRIDDNFWIDHYRKVIDARLGAMEEVKRQGSPTNPDDAKYLFEQYNELKKYGGDVLEFDQRIRNLSPSAEEPEFAAHGGRIGLDGGGALTMNMLNSSSKIKEFDQAWQQYRRGGGRWKRNTFFKAWAPENMAEGGSAGQLVQNTVDGSRPGYGGDDTVVDRTVQRYNYDKSTKQKLKTIYKNIQEYKNIKTFRTADKEAEIIKRLKNFALDFKEATGRLPVQNEIRSFGVASQSVTSGKKGTYLKKGVNYIEQTADMIKSKSYVTAFTPETPIVNEAFDLYDQGMSKKAISEKLKVDRTHLRSWFHKWRPEDIGDENKSSGKGKWQSQKKYTKILADLKKELKGMEGGKEILARMEAHLDDIWNKNDDILAMSDQQILKSKKIKQAMNLNVSGLKIGEGLNYNRYANLSDADYVAKVKGMAETRQFYQPEHLIAINKKNVASLLPENIVSVSGKIGSQMETLKNYVTKNPKDKFVFQIDELFKSQDIPSSSNIIKLNKKTGAEILGNFWCNTKQIVKKAGGGRIGFSGSCSAEVKQKNFLRMTNEVATGKVTGEAAEQIAKNAGKVVAKAGSKSVLAAIFGPAGIGLDIAFEVGSIGIDVAGGKSWNRALQDNWITGAFISGTGQEEFHKELYAKDSKAKPYGQALDLIDAYNKAQKNIDFVKQSNYRGPGQKEQALAEAERDLRGIEASYNALTKHGKIMEEGSNEYENYMAAKTEFEDAAKAKSYASKQKLKFALDTPESDRFTPSYKPTGMKIDFSLPKGHTMDMAAPGAPMTTSFKPNLPTIEDINKIWKDEGYKGTLPIDRAKEFITGEKWLQLFEQPGIKGTQDWRGATGGRAGYMGGGITAIRRPNAIPPKRQGLRSILINGKKS